MFSVTNGFEPNQIKELAMSEDTLVGQAAQAAQEAANAVEAIDMTPT